MAHGAQSVHYMLERWCEVGGAHGRPRCKAPCQVAAPHRGCGHACEKGQEGIEEGAQRLPEVGVCGRKQKDIEEALQGPAPHGNAPQHVRHGQPDVLEGGACVEGPHAWVQAECCYRADIDRHQLCTVGAHADRRWHRAVEGIALHEHAQCGEHGGHALAQRLQCQPDLLASVPQNKVCHDLQGQIEEDVEEEVVGWQHVEGQKVHGHQGHPDEGLDGLADGRGWVVEHRGDHHGGVAPALLKERHHAGYDYEGQRRVENEDARLQQHRGQPHAHAYDQRKEAQKLAHKPPLGEIAKLVLLFRG